MLLDYPSSQALWILFADQRPKLGLGLLFVLPVLYLFADVLTLPVHLNTCLGIKFANGSICLAPRFPCDNDS